MTEFEDKIYKAVDQGYHVTIDEIGGMKVAIIHNPTDACRKNAITEFDTFKGGCE